MKHYELYMHELERALNRKTTWNKFELLLVINRYIPSLYRLGSRKLAWFLRVQQKYTVSREKFTIKFEVKNEN